MKLAKHTEDEGLVIIELEQGEDDNKVDIEEIKLLVEGAIRSSGSVLLDFYDVTSISDAHITMLHELNEFCIMGDFELAAIGIIGATPLNFRDKLALVMNEASLFFFESRDQALGVLT